ncbi:MAG: DUF1638 domain-containing protein [Gammaproteobacteria bacterium]|nr:DUF1638 domain-containing protein [Gammaproteobacteria bacterium]
MHADAPERSVLVLACGALAREILAIIELNRLAHVELVCLPASLHNRPERIVPEVSRVLDEVAGRYERVLVAYADCGTGGALDRLLQERGIARLPGAHCYAFYSGVASFERTAEADMRAFFLTDFLVRQFETLVIEGLGLDRHPELRDAYFGNYEKVVYLSQAPDADLIAAAEVAAARLGLAFEHRHVGYGDLPGAITDAAQTVRRAAERVMGGEAR